MMQQSMSNKEIQTLSFIEELDETQLIGIVGGSTTGDAVANLGAATGQAGILVVGVVRSVANTLATAGPQLGGIVQDTAGN